MANPFVGYDNIVCFLAPQDIGSTATTCPYVDLRNANKAFFLIQFGAITSTTATDESVVTIQAATAVDGTEAAVAFRYRKSGAVGANTWGAITTADTTGVGMGADDSDNMALLIEIDPDELAANDYRYARAVLTDNVDLEACLVAGFAFIEARYKQTTHLSATASASA
jgi:hypothetical protein